MVDPLCGVVIQFGNLCTFVDWNWTFIIYDLILNIFFILLTVSQFGCPISCLLIDIYIWANRDGLELLKKGWNLVFTIYGGRIFFWNMAVGEGGNISEELWPLHIIIFSLSRKSLPEKAGKHFMKYIFLFDIRNLKMSVSCWCWTKTKARRTIGN